MFDLLNASKNGLLVIALVNISANWSLDQTKGRQTILASSFSLMRCLSTSICLVRSCWTTLSEMLIAVVLLHMSLQVWFAGKPSLVNNFLIQRILHIHWTISWNSASALERATTFCFLFLYVTTFPSTKVKYPTVDFRPLGFPAQSAPIFLVHSFLK